MKKDKVLILMLLPSLIGVLIFYIIPFLWSSKYIIFSTNKVGEFALWDNIQEVVTSKSFHIAFSNTGVYMVVSIVLSCVISLGLAMLINTLPSMKKIFTTLTLVTLCIPTGSVVAFWKMLIQYNGYINYLFFRDNPIEWANDKNAMVIIIIMFIWRSLGYNIILFLVGLNTIPKVYYEAFKVEGGNSFMIFRKVTFVYILPSTVIVLLMSTVNIFKWYKDVYSLVGNYPNTNLYLIQHYLTNQFMALSYNKVVVASYILATIFGIITYVFLRIQKGVEFSE